MLIVDNFDKHLIPPLISLQVNLDFAFCFIHLIIQRKYKMFLIF